MYISIEQLESSLRKLDPINPFFGISFLAFKKLGLRIGDPRPVNIAEEETAILEADYNPQPTSGYYYIPLRKTGPKKKRWVSKRKYPSSTLQKTRTTTFAEAFMHPRNRPEWAWKPDYLSKLVSLANAVKVPTFDLAVWMFRDRDWPENTQPADIVNYFLSEFNITEEENRSLFDTTPLGTLPFITIFQKEPVTWKALRRLIGSPPDEVPEEGGGLESLELIGVGPAKIMKLEFAPRLNLITGDNGLGKTFLLECAWWALSGSWADPEQPAYPRSDSTGSSSISFKISGSPNKPIPIYFDRAAQQWPLPEQKRPVLPGIVIYARVDGSSMIWDPAKHYWPVEDDRARGLETTDAIRLNQAEIWDGLRSGNRSFVCNGLIRDWIDWQYIPPKTTFETFSKVLQKLSPSPHEMTLIPSTPIKLPRDDTQMPRLRLPYDDVPITLLSAAMKLTIIYVHTTHTG